MPFISAALRFVSSQGQPMHTQPRFALVCTSSSSILQLLLSNAKTLKADFSPALSQGPLQTLLALLPRALLALCFCMKPEGFSSTA